MHPKTLFDIQMRKYISNILLLFATMMAVTSCLGDDENKVILYDDTAITAFSLTGADIYNHTISSTGEDSVYKVNAATSVSEILFHIDQIKAEVFNTDSLPVGTDVSKMLCSLSTLNNGVPFIESLEPEDPVYLSTTDSIDFSEPRVIRIYSSDGQRYRPYTIRVNLHKEVGDSFVWKAMPVNPDLATVKKMRAAVVGQHLVVLAQQGNGTHVYRHNTTAGAQWECKENLFAASASENITVRHDSLFVLDGQTLWVSTDGEHFDELLTNSGLSQLLGANSKQMYALNQLGSIMVSTDGGRSWNTDRVASSADVMPVTDIAYTSLPQGFTGNSEYSVFAGSRDSLNYPDDAYGKVWRKIVDANNSQDNKWICINEDLDGRYSLPRLSNLQLFVYDGAMIAIGGKGIGGCDKEAYSQFYESRDGGITWKDTKRCVLPAGFDSTLTTLAVTVDTDNHIWMICGGTGQVWRGRLNRLGWKQ